MPARLFITCPFHNAKVRILTSLCFGPSLLVFKVSLNSGYYFCPVVGNKKKQSDKNVLPSLYFRRYQIFFFVVHTSKEYTKQKKTSVFSKKKYIYIYLYLFVLKSMSYLEILWLIIMTETNTNSLIRRGIQGWVTFVTFTCFAVITCILQLYSCLRDFF